MSSPHWVIALALAILLLVGVSILCAYTRSETCWRLRDLYANNLRDLNTWRGIVALAALVGGKITDTDLLNLLALITAALAVLEIIWPPDRR